MLQCNLEGTTTFSPGIEITDFQTRDKMFELSNIYRTFLKSIGRHVWVHDFKLPQLVYLLKCMIATFDVQKYSFCEISTQCINKPCIIFFQFFFIPFTAKSYTRFKYIDILDKKRRQTFSCQKNLIQDRKQLNNSRIMQVLLIFSEETLDKQNEQVPLEFKVKVNNSSCLQRVRSLLMVRCINV